MITFFGFEPFEQLLKATACGSQINANAVQAYRLACDYYGENRVALQKDANRVEYVTTPTKRFIKGCLTNLLWGWNAIPMTLSSLGNVLYAKNIPSLYNLFIHWPTATVSNEQDQSIEIKDLFARIQLTHQGLSFSEYEKLTFTKTTFSKAQWNSDYVHSHVSPNTSIDNFTFRHVCLGTGPILNTIAKLQGEPNNVEATMLFFWELDKVVHVESLRGVPYIRMSSLTSERLNPITEIDREPNALYDYKTSPIKGMVKDFMLSFIKAVELPFAFKDGKYTLGCSFLDFVIILTNYYKKWRDAYIEMVYEELVRPYDSLFVLRRHMIIKDGKLYSRSGERRSRGVAGYSTPFIFNGKEYPLVIEDDLSEGDYMSYELLPLNIARSILDFILTSINIATSQKYEEYGEKTKEEDNVRDKWLYPISSRVSENRDSGKTSDRTSVII